MKDCLEVSIKKDWLVDALPETVHSSLCKLRCYANSVQQRTKRGLSRLNTLQGFQARVMAYNFTSCFTSNWGMALCCFRSNYGYVLPLLPALPCSNLPLVCVRDLRLIMIISTLIYANFESRFWVWMSAYNYCCALIHKKVAQNNRTKFLIQLKTISITVGWKDEQSVRIIQASG